MSDEKDPITKDQDPSVPGNIGGSPQRGAEDVAKQEQEAGREDVEPQGKTQRPAGKSTTRDVTGINPQKIITRDSPAG